MRHPSPPQISVVMTVYNGAGYLRKSIDSVLRQTFHEFEFLVVDDGSTDETPAMLAKAAAEDRRVKIVTNQDNRGLTASINIGLRHARAPIIARIDGDDICAPNRLADQFSFLEMHPDHLMVGSGYRAIDHSGKVLYTKINPMDSFAARWLSRFRTPMPHPSICFRATLPDGTPVRYEEDLPVAQDFELIARLARAGRIASLGAPLIDYRMHAGNISANKKALQHANARQIAGRSMAADLPTELARRLDGFLDIYFLGRTATPGLIAESVAALDDMVALDVEAEPRRRTWLKRQTAGVLAEAIIRRGGGLRNPAALSAFAVHARHYLPALAGRVLENTGRLPGRWQSFPEPSGIGA